MRLLLRRHAFRIPIVLHSRLYKILIDCTENGAERVERGVEEHLVGLNFQGVEGFAVEGLAWGL